MNAYCAPYMFVEKVLLVGLGLWVALHASSVPGLRSPT